MFRSDHEQHSIVVIVAVVVVVVAAAVDVAVLTAVAVAVAETGARSVASRPSLDTVGEAIGWPAGVYAHILVIHLACDVGVGDPE